MSEEDTYREINSNPKDFRYSKVRDGVWIGDEVFLPRWAVLATFQALNEGEQQSADEVDDGR